MVAVAVPVLTGVNDGVTVVTTEAVPVAVDVNDGVSVGLTVAVRVVMGVSEGVNVGLAVAVPVIVGVSGNVAVTVGRAGVDETATCFAVGALVDVGVPVRPGALVGAIGCTTRVFVGRPGLGPSGGVSIAGPGVCALQVGVTPISLDVGVPGFVGSNVGVIGGVGVAGFTMIT